MESVRVDRGLESSASSLSENLTGQVAVQVTGVLRNLAVSPSHAAAFVSSGVVRALRVTAEAMSAGVGTASGRPSAHQSSEEVLLNVGRILSKLSLHEECQVRTSTRMRIYGE